MALYPTFNSDVETFHRLVEDEFYSIEDVENKTDLVRKAYTYLLDNQHLYFQSIPNKHSHRLSRLTASHKNPVPVASTALDIDIDVDESLYAWGWDFSANSVFKDHNIPKGGYYLPGLDIKHNISMF